MTAWAATTIAWFVIAVVCAYLSGWSRGHQRAMRAWRKTEERIRRSALPFDWVEVDKDLAPRQVDVLMPGQVVYLPNGNNGIHS